MSKLYHEIGFLATLHIIHPLSYNLYMTKSAYIHIPFCKSKCYYCSFVSYVQEEKKDSYIEALCRQIEQNYEDEMLSTIYFGGGTPSVLSPEQISKVLSLFNTLIMSPLLPSFLNLCKMEFFLKLDIYTIQFAS